MKKLFERLKPRKMNHGGVVPLADEDRFPEVIKESKIKPTTCKGCFCVYQAKHKHLKMAFTMGKRMTTCPVCKTDNAVEFEMDGEDSEP